MTVLVTVPRCLGMSDWTVVHPSLVHPAMVPAWVLVRVLVRRPMDMEMSDEIEYRPPLVICPSILPGGAQQKANLQAVQPKPTWLAHSEAIVAYPGVPSKAISRSAYTGSINNGSSKAAQWQSGVNIRKPCRKGNGGSLAVQLIHN